ncbi:MAG: DUF3870 domain-containing protein [Paenibacillaceae bacterium]
MQMEKLNSALVTGYSKAPQGTSMYEVYKHAGIVLEIDLETNQIVNAEFTFIAQLTRDYFKRLMVGYNLSDGLDPLILRIQEHYFAPSQQSIIVALQSAVQRYWDCTKTK